MASSRDLDEAERYAAAALFTLALHIIQVSVMFVSCSWRRQRKRNESVRGGKSGENGLTDASSKEEEEEANERRGALSLSLSLTYSLSF